MDGFGEVAVIRARRFLHGSPAGVVGGPVDAGKPGEDRSICGTMQKSCAGGLPLSKDFSRGDGRRRMPIHEGKAQFTVDIAEGQKTGWFCDQRENRWRQPPCAKGKRVLEAFCHTGAFGIRVALAGRNLWRVDVSAAAVAMAQAHATQESRGCALHLPTGRCLR